MNSSQRDQQLAMRTAEQVISLIGRSFGIRPEEIVAPILQALKEHRTMASQPQSSDPPYHPDWESIAPLPQRSEQQLAAERQRADKSDNERQQLDQFRKHWTTVHKVIRSDIQVSEGAESISELIKLYKNLAVNKKTIKNSK